MDGDDVIAARLRLLAEYVKDLRDGRPASLEEYRADKWARRAAERTLQVAVEACLDIGHRLIAQRAFRSPQDSKDVFVILGEEGVLPSPLVPSLVNAAKFRNLLVHDYARLDDAAVYGILTRRLGDFDEFARSVVSYLQRRE